MFTMGLTLDSVVSWCYNKLGINHFQSTRSKGNMLIQAHIPINSKIKTAVGHVFWDKLKYIVSLLTTRLVAKINIALLCAM